MFDRLHNVGAASVVQHARLLLMHRCASNRVADVAQMDLGVFKKAVLWVLNEIPAQRRSHSTAATLYRALHDQHVSDGTKRVLRLPRPGTFDVCDVARPRHGRGLSRRG